MKKIFSLSMFVLFLSVSGSAQNPLVGTWEMVSIKGINAEGERFSLDTTSIHEIKIITPTHYMLIASDVFKDSLIFNRSYAGTVRLEGNKYIETPSLASVPIYDNFKADFTWRLEGDRFIQSGIIVRPDGKKIVLEELVFRPLKTKNVYKDNPSIGEWNQLTTAHTNAQGKRITQNNEKTTRFHIITPTHWMRISMKNKKFENAMGGSYTMSGDKTYPNLEYASFPLSTLGKMEMTEHLDGDKLYVTGLIVTPTGRRNTWDDVFQRVK
jgi:hypothetical protein